MIAGRYRIEALLGQGGFGKVYRAFDQKLERVVALKLLSRPQDRPEREDRVLRFEDEVRTVARLDHPSIVPVYDAGLEDEIPWMAMKLVVGPSLEKVLRDGGSLLPARALPLLIHVAGALSHAHRHGIVHRDVKPANILLEERDGGEHAWLTDFGIAKILTGLHLTRKGEILGTPSYMSPEQVTGRQVDARTDIFSFGCAAAELVTGRRAFRGNSAVEVLYAILHKAPDLDELRERAGPGFEAAVLRCLAKSPEDRWQTFDDLIHELETLVLRPAPGTLVALPAKSRVSGLPSAHQAALRRKWWLWLAVFGVLAAILARQWPDSSAQKTESRISAPTTPDRLHLLRGQILDAETRLPLPRVLVSLPELGLQSITNDQGQYRFEIAVPAGTQVQLRATHEGYEPVDADPPVGSDHLETHRMWRNQ